MHNRDTLKIKAIKSNDPHDWANFKRMRNKVNTEIKVGVLSRKTREATPHPFLDPHALPSEFPLGGMHIFWNYTISLVKQGTRLLKFQPMHCTVPCISSQHLACCGLFCLNWRFFNTPWKISGALYCNSGRSRV